MCSCLPRVRSAVLDHDALDDVRTQQLAGRGHDARRSLTKALDDLPAITLRQSKRSPMRLETAMSRSVPASMLRLNQHVIWEVRIVSESSSLVSSGCMVNRPFGQRAFSSNLATP